MTGFYVRNLEQCASFHIKEHMSLTATFGFSWIEGRLRTVAVIFLFHDIRCMNIGIIWHHLFSVTGVITIRNMVSAGICLAVLEKVTVFRFS